MTASRLHRHRPIPRRRTALAAVALLAALLLGMLLAVDQLRHPFPGDRATLPPETGDPREEVVCPDPRPVEGEPRGTELQPELPPTRVRSDELYDCPESWNGRVVRYRGEVVGAVLRRSVGAWVQLNDDVYAEDVGPLPAHRDYRGGNAGVGVLVPLELAEEIEHVGGPRSTGDVLEVTGTFRRIDPATREVAVVVADAGEVVSRGAPISDPVLPDRAVAAAVLGLLAAGVVVAERVVAARS